MEFQLPDVNLQRMLPEIALFVWALLVITVDVVTRRKSGQMIGYLAMAGPAVSAIIMMLLFVNFSSDAEKGNLFYGEGFGRMFYNDPMALFFKVIFLGAAFMTIGCSFGVTKEKIVNHRGEFLGLILFSTVGMMFLASSSELLSLYIGLELTTIPLFVLAGFFKDDKKSVEAGIKYLVVGAFSSALLLYGLSFLYGMTGTTDILQMRLTLATGALSGFMADYSMNHLVMIVATVCILAGIGFKLALPPFHQWAPDVYEGAPTPVTAFLSVGSKAAGVVAFAKIMVMGLYAYYEPYLAPIDWGVMVGVLAAAGMIIGNVLAIRQTNIKRMLAYSSIAHAGYLMVGMLAMNELGLASVSFYMFAYLFTNMGAFAIVIIVEDHTGGAEISRYSGLSKNSPALAMALTVFLLSLTGIPPLAGFFAKYYIFAAAIKLAATTEGGSWLYWLVGIGLVTSVFALYYYANVIKKMYFEAAISEDKVVSPPAAIAVLTIAIVGVVAFGLYPEPILEFASKIPFTYAILAP